MNRQRDPLPPPLAVRALRARSRAWSPHAWDAALVPQASEAVGKRARWVRRIRASPLASVESFRAGGALPKHAESVRTEQKVRAAGDSSYLELAPSA